MGKHEAGKALKNKLRKVKLRKEASNLHTLSDEELTSLRQSSELAENNRSVLIDELRTELNSLGSGLADTTRRAVLKAELDVLRAELIKARKSKV